MSRPRKNFFIRFDEIKHIPGDKPEIGDIIMTDSVENYTIIKIHPRKGGVTARKAP